jgi:hypothetical protein
LKEGNFLLYELSRVDQGLHDHNDFRSNFGLAVATTEDSCPLLWRWSCLFVDASSIGTDIRGYLGYQYMLGVGLQANAPPAAVHVYLVDESLASLCQRPADVFSEGVRGFFTFSPSSAQDMRDYNSTEATGVLLQLTRRRELARGGGGGGGGNMTHTRDRNSYRAEFLHPSSLNNMTIFDSPADLYPLITAGDVASVRTRWSDEAYRLGIVTPLMEEFWRGNGTNSYYFLLTIFQLSEVVTYTQHDPVDPVALLGIYGEWRGGVTRLSFVSGCLTRLSPSQPATGTPCSLCSAR